MWDCEEKEGEEEGEKVMDTTTTLVKAYTQKRAKSLWKIQNNGGQKETKTFGNVTARQSKYCFSRRRRCSVCFFKMCLASASSGPF